MAKASSHYLAELLAPWGAVEIKRTFGGLGAWRDGAFFALIVDDIIYFKVDEQSRADYVAAHSEPFSYVVTKGEEQNTRVINGLWRLPDEILEDHDRLFAWAQRASDVARAKMSKHPKTRKLFNALGPRSANWLQSVGISSQADLEAHGVIATYRLLKARYPKAISLNMLWGLYAAVNHLELAQITPDIKDHLRDLLKSDPV